MSEQNDNTIKKHKKTKNDIYKAEQLIIFDKLCKILDITEKQNSFLETTVSDKENNIKALCEEIKKFYPSKVWFRSAGEVKTATIAKQIFVHHGYAIISKNVSIKTNNETNKVKKYFISKNE